MVRGKYWDMGNKDQVRKLERHYKDTAQSLVKDYPSIEDCMCPCPCPPKESSALYSIIDTNTGEVLSKNHNSESEAYNAAIDDVTSGMEDITGPRPTHKMLYDLTILQKKGYLKNERMKIVGHPIKW